MPTMRLAVIGAIAAAVLPCHAADAQIRASERASVSQTVDGTVITVDYSRPQVRGRTELFGKVIPPEEIWTPGANSATNLTVSRDITLGGKPLPAGKYSMWLVTRTADWKMYFHRNPTLFHTRPPKLDSDSMALSIPVLRQPGENAEALTFDFPRVSTTGTELRMRWGTISIPMDIGVTPSRSTVVMKEEEAARYTGSYLLTFGGENGGRSKPINFEIVNAKGVLHGIADYPKDPFELEFIPTDVPNRYLPAFVKEGKVFDVETTTPTTFEIVNGRAVGFNVGMGPNPWMQGKRKS